jgi:hypothetical protein
MEEIVESVRTAKPLASLHAWVSNFATCFASGMQRIIGSGFAKRHGRA